MKETERSRGAVDLHTPRKLAPGQRRRTLRDGTIDGSLYSAMLGVAEGNLVAFALALGLGTVWSGLTASIPVLVGSIIQTATPAVIRRARSHKLVLVSCAIMQATIWSGLAVLALYGSAHPLLLYGAVMLYWALALGAGTAWATFISLIVPARVRATYFASRTRIQNTALVMGTLGGGAILFLGQRGGEGPEWWRVLAGWGGGVYPFAVLFLLAAVLRFLSSAYLVRQVEVVAIPRGQRDVPLRELIGRYRHGSGGRLILYMLAAQLAIQVSTPFVTPYLLEHVGLKNNYSAFGLLLAVLVLAKVVVLPYLGMLAKRHGPRLLLRIGGVMVVPLPALWLLVDDNFIGLLIVQALNGAGLAAYELGTFLLLFEDIEDEERTSVMSRYHVVSYGATLGGSLIGAGVLNQLGTTVGVYAVVFTVSVLVRAMTIPLMLGVARGRPDASRAMATLEVHPLPGSMDEPVVGPSGPRRSA